MRSWGMEGLVIIKMKSSIVGVLPSWPGRIGIKTLRKRNRRKKSLLKGLRIIIRGELVLILWSLKLSY